MQVVLYTLRWEAICDALLRWHLGRLYSFYTDAGYHQKKNIHLHAFLFLRKGFVCMVFFPFQEKK